jgi:hypothetical protein
MTKEKAIMELIDKSQEIGALESCIKTVWDDRPRIDKAGQNRRSDGWKSDAYCQPRQQSY